MIGILSASALVAFTPVSQFPAFFRCRVQTVAPTVTFVDDVILTAVSKDWSFDDKFAKLTGARTAVSEMGVDGLVLKGEVTAHPQWQFEGALVVNETDNKKIVIDWRVYNRSAPNAEPIIETSGLAMCDAITSMSELQDKKS